MPVWVPAVMAVALLGIGFFNIGRATCLREGNAMNLARSRIERSAANVLVKIVWGILASGGYGLLVGEVIGAWAALRKVGSRLLTQSIILREKLGHEVGAVWRRFRKFPYLELPSSLFDQATLTLPVPMLASIGGTEVAGAYAIARMVVVVPNAQIGRAVGDGFQLRVSQIVRGGNESELLVTIGKTISLLAVVGVLPFGLLWLLSPWAFPFFLGSEWSSSGELAALLAIWMYFAFVVSPVSRVLSVLQRQEIKLYYDLFVFCTICLIYWYSMSNQVSSQEFVQALVALNVIGYSLFLILILFVAGKAR
jgi:O-antigen/teichoic acid export membrane protein